MKIEEYNKAKEKIKEIEEDKRKRDYFLKPYDGMREEDIKRKKREGVLGKFHFKLKVIREKKVEVEVENWGMFGRESIEVDEEFLKYCGEYFDRRIKDKEKEFNEI